MFTGVELQWCAQSETALGHGRRASSLATRSTWSMGNPQKLRRCVHSRWPLISGLCPWLYGVAQLDPTPMVAPQWRSPHDFELFGSFSDCTCFHNMTIHDRPKLFQLMLS